MGGLLILCERYLRPIPLAARGDYLLLGLEIAWLPVCSGKNSPFLLKDLIYLPPCLLGETASLSLRFLLSFFLSGEG